jgi:hypothetical protein
MQVCTECLKKSVKTSIPWFYAFGFLEIDVEKSVQN